MSAAEKDGGSGGIVLVGAGNHARASYLPFLAEARQPPRLVVELRSREASARHELARQGCESELFLVDDELRDAERLPSMETAALLRRITQLGIDKGIIATEPKAHMAYAWFFVSNGIHTLLDKPISAPARASTDPDAAARVYSDYLELAELHARRPGINLVVQCQRRYSSIYRHARSLLDEAVGTHGAPVTHIECYHGNGHWNMPPEFLGREDHPHTYGYGKLLHSGFHFVDLFAWISEANGVLPDRDPNRIRLTQLTQQPKDLLFQLDRSLYQRFFGADVLATSSIPTVPGISRASARRRHAR